MNENKKSKSSIKRAKRKELKRQRMQKITDFIHHYNNNTLHLLKDDIYLYEDEIKEIIDILSKGKNKTRIVNEIILKTGKVLPKLSLRINQLYLYNGNINYQNFINIYNNLNFNVPKNSAEYFFNIEIINEILSLIGNIYLTQKHYSLIDNQDQYILLQLNYKQFKLLYYISFKLYKYLSNKYKQLNAITFVLADLYKFYLQNMLINKQKKFFLNIIIQLLILEFENSMLTISN